MARTARRRSGEDPRSTGGRIGDPGKFEGEMDYAPYFYERVLESDFSNEVEVDGVSVTIWDITKDDLRAFPSIGKSTKQVAFYERDDGVWVETDVPMEADPDFPSETMLETSAVIQETRGGYTAIAEGRRLDTFRERDGAFRALRKWMKNHNVWLNLYYINERGNVGLLDSKGREIKGWV